VDFQNNSELFRRATKRSKPELRHPTDSKFDPKLWRDAVSNLDKATSYDVNLAQSAILLGIYITQIRENLDALLSSCSQNQAVELMVAYANRGFVKVRKSAEKSAKRLAKRGDFHDVETFLHSDIYESGLGQKITIDSALESLVDSLPGWYYHSKELSNTNAKFSDDEIPSLSLKVSTALSIEHTYRIIWQKCLWQGWWFKKSASNITLYPSDIKLEEKWRIWNIRELSLASQGSRFDALFFTNPKLAELAVEPLIEKSVISYENRSGKKKKPIIGCLPKMGERQLNHSGDWTSVRSSYLAEMLTEQLSTAEQKNITPIMLIKAWFVLSDLVEVQLRSLPISKMTTYEIMRRYSLPIRPEHLVSTITKSLNCDEALAHILIDYLTVDVADNTLLFNEGFWSSPLIPSPNGEFLHLIAPVLLTANLTRCVENWIKRASITMKSKTVGDRFEEQLRLQLNNDCKLNEDLTDWGCPLSGLPTAKDGEQIDALFFVGNTVLVIEAKSSFSPSEPIEQFDFLEKLDEACDQVKRKVTWLDNQRGKLKTSFKWSEQKSARARIFPVVVTNQAYGLGYQSAGVPVVDLHYMRLLFGGSNYVSCVAENNETGLTAASTEQLYKSQTELESQLFNLLLHPVSLKRFEGCLGWKELLLVPFEDGSLNTMIVGLNTPATTGQPREILKSIVDSNCSADPNVK